MISPGRVFRRDTDDATHSHQFHQIEGLVVGKAKHSSTTATLKSGFVGMSRWGIKGVEDLGNGYAVGFILEQGFNADSGNESVAGKAFSRESFLYLTGDFGRFGFGRTGTLASGAQSNNILTGWALGTGYGLSSWTSAIGTSFSRVDNAVAYVSPNFNGFTVTAAYGTNALDNQESLSGNAKKQGRLFAIAPVYTNGIEEDLFKVGFCLPAGPYVSDDDVHYIVDCIKEAIVK